MDKRLRLAIDAGNTQLVFGLVDGTRVVQRWRIASDDGRTADEYAAWLLPLLTLNGLSFAQIEACLICSVRPGANAALNKFARRYLGQEAQIVGQPPLDAPVVLAVDAGTKVGADRLINAYAVKALGWVPSIVLDFGTATTLDVTTHDGRYSGGIIAPGVNLSAKALAEAAAHLPSVALARPAQVLGRNTVDAMQSGLFWGYMGLIEGLVQRLSAELSSEITGGQPLELIATGGLSSLFVEAGLKVARQEPDLTLFGLAHLAEARL